MSAEPIKDINWNADLKPKPSMEQQVKAIFLRGPNHIKQ